MTTVTRQQSEAMDECAEWAAREHPLPWPQRGSEPLPTRPFAPGVIDGPERKRPDIGFAFVVAVACAVGGLIWWVVA